MNFEFHLFEPISLTQVSEAFPEWDKDFCDKAHANWLELFNKRSHFLCSTQLSNHYETLQKMFCREHGLSYIEDIREYGYHEAFESYLYEYGYTERSIEYNNHTKILHHHLHGSPMLVVTARELADDFLAHLTSPVSLPNDHYIEGLIMALWFNTIVDNSSEQIASLRKLPYPEYLRTSHWRRVRSAMILARGARCQHERCEGLDSYWAGGESQLNVHHLNYKNRGNERFEDLTLLCEDCHKREHGIKGK